VSLANQLAKGHARAIVFAEQRTKEQKNRGQIFTDCW